MIPIQHLTPGQARQQAQQEGCLLVDVRETAETASGHPEGARLMPLGEVLDQAAELAAQNPGPVLFICQSGNRSQRAAEALAATGHRAAASVDGGFLAWQLEQLPAIYPAGLNHDSARRYARQLVLPEFGPEGQRRLLESRVLLIGAGGLGSPAALYLAAAGVGQLGLVDDDVVESSNLQRQVIHSEHTLGEAKVSSAAEHLQALNSGIQVRQHRQRLDRDNVDALFEGYDLVIDGSDNLPTRYLASDAALKHGLPLVYGAVYRFQGQVSVFWPAKERGRWPCYRCLFPEPPAPEDAPSCATAGVLGVVPGIIGSLQALEAIKILSGTGQPLLGRLLVLDAMQSGFRELKLSADPACDWCAPEKPFPGYGDYLEFCAG